MSKEEKKNPSEYYVIDTRTSNTHQAGKKNPGRDYQELNLIANEEYAELVGYQQNGKLREKTNGSPIDYALRGRASNFHDMSHMTPEVFQNKTDENGFIWIKDREDAKRVMKNLLKLDPEVEFFPMGKTMTKEELLSPSPAQSHVPQPVIKK
jgi:hypothetical protein